MRKWNGCFHGIVFLALCGGGGSPLFAAAPRGLPWDGWADIVLGQRDFSGWTLNQPTGHTVCNPGGVLVDRSSNPQRLYVYDSGNNRILGFNDISVFQPNQPVTAGGFNVDRYDFPGYPLPNGNLVDRFVYPDDDPNAYLDQAPAGDWDYLWDVKSRAGSAISSGLYIMDWQALDGPELTRKTTRLLIQR